MVSPEVAFGPSVAIEVYLRLTANHWFGLVGRVVGLGVVFREWLTSVGLWVSYPLGMTLIQISIISGCEEGSTAN